MGIIKRELQHGRSKVTLFLDALSTAIWIEEADSGEQSGGGHRTEQEARDWFNGQLDEWQSRGYMETLNSLARQEFVKGSGQARRFWAVEIVQLQRWTRFGRVTSQKGRAGRYRQFDTEEELQRSCRRMIEARLRMGYVPVDRMTNIL